MTFANTLRMSVITGVVAVSPQSHAGIAEDLKEVARSMEGSLPIKVDGEKRLETVAASQDTLIFKYKVTNESTFRDPRFDASKYTRALLESQRSSVCRDPGTLNLLRRGAKFNYLMVGRDGRKMIDFTLTFSGCHGTP